MYYPSQHLPGQSMEIYNQVMVKSSQTVYDLEKIKSKDGQIIQLFVAIRPIPKNTNKVLLIHHGHGSGAHGQNMKNICFEGNNAGFLSMVMVRVGSETSICTQPRLYSVDQYADDIEACVKFINKRYNNPDLYTLGESMGAAVVAVYQSKCGKRGKWPFKAQACLACPFQLDIITKHLSQPENSLLGRLYVQGLQGPIYNNYDLLKKHEKDIKYKVDECLQTFDVRLFDKYFSAPMNGFVNLKDFYEYISPIYYLKDINIPTLFIHSQDDSICIQECIPNDYIWNNKKCILIETQQGGHLGFLTGSYGEETHWNHKVALEFLTHEASKIDRQKLIIQKLIDKQKQSKKQ